MIALGQDVRRLELWAAAAAAAREVLREAMASKSCAWWTLFVALKVRTLHAVSLHARTLMCTACTLHMHMHTAHAHAHAHVHCMRTARALHVHCACEE